MTGTGRTGPRSRLERWGPVLSIAGTLLVWEGCARAGVISSTFFPAPSAILAVMRQLLLDGQIATHAGATLARVLVGFVIGGGAGLLLGLAMGASPRLHASHESPIAIRARARSGSRPRHTPRRAPPCESGT